MRIGILQTGKVNESLVEVHGEYPPMFRDWLATAGDALDLPVFSVVDGEFPSTPDLCDGWLISGSRFGVYDDEPWIAPLKDFLCQTRSAGRPILGICFGHQILVEAFGGRAEKFQGGWGVGVNDYQVTARPVWMADAPETISLHAHHQDQVTAIPEDATCLATSGHCAFAMLAYGNPEAPDAVSIQAHPEFRADYARDLVKTFTGTRIPEDAGARALETFGRPVHGPETAAWSIAFLRNAIIRRAAA